MSKQQNGIRNVGRSSGRCCSGLVWKVPPPPAVRINATKIQTADVQTRPRQEHRSRSELVARLINTNQLSCFQPKEQNTFEKREDSGTRSRRRGGTRGG